MFSIFTKYLNELAFSDFNIGDIEVHNLIFADGYVVDYTKQGRTKHLLHLMLSGKRTYYVKGEEIELEGQNALFIPHGTVYSTKSHNAGSTACTGIGISFYAILKDGSFLEFPRGIYTRKCGNRTKELFLEIDRVYREIPLKHAKLKALTLELISHLAKENASLAQILKPAIEFINLTYTKNLTVKEYAEKCNLSESYFRKIFKAYMGLSPIDYRNELRFAKAEQLYQSGQNLEQIAEDIGFCDAVFFSKLYKKRFGVSIKNRLKTV